MLKFFYQSLNLFIFIWGSFCLNDFREALRCNALGDYTDTNIDINTLLLLSVVNCFVNLVNYDYNVFLLLLNNIMIIILAGFNIKLIRCSILDNNLLYLPLCAQLVRKNWVSSGSFKLNEYDPFSNATQWKMKLRQLQLIYYRTVNQKSIEIANFDSLSDLQRQILTNVDAPQWSKPFNSSLFSTMNSKFSYVIFRKHIPLSWVIADMQDSNSLFVETSWFNPSITSSAAVFSLFYLIFKETFGWNGLKGEKSFSFRFLTNNRSMHNLDQWLAPFVKRSCLCQSYDFVIEQI